jgi:DnaK suppressor protein
MALTAKQLAEFEQAIRTERASVSKPLDTTELVTDKQADEVDIAAKMAEQTIYHKLSARNTLYVKKLTEALARIAEGKYGECEGCGDDIDIKRLKARLTATFCVLCKEEQERMERALKQTGGASGWEE